MINRLFCGFAALLLFSVSASAIPVASRDPYAGAIVIDARTGIALFEDKADVPVFPASVVKLMDMLVILEQIKAGKLSLKDKVHVTARASRMGGSQVYLKEGEIFTIDELLYSLIIQSANDSAVALAIHVAGTTDNFVKLMNEKASALGMNSTLFNSVHGLPPGKGQDPDVSTARDIALLSRELVRHKELFQYTSTREKGFRQGKFIMRTHNRLLADVEGCDGLKTGYFTAAGFSISATAKRGNDRIIAVVMGCKSRKTRDAKARELIAQGFLDLEPIRNVVAQKAEKAAEQVKAAKPEIKDTKPDGPSFLAKIGNIMKFLLKLIVAVVVLGGMAFGAGYYYVRKRDSWKYKM